MIKSTHQKRKEENARMKIAQNLDKTKVLDVKNVQINIKNNTCPVHVNKSPVLIQIKKEYLADIYGFQDLRIECQRSVLGVIRN